ncbi:hypothetical protein D9M72_402700 [compost metagenome]
MHVVVDALHLGLVGGGGIVAGRAHALDHQLARGGCVAAQVGLQRHQRVAFVDLRLHRLAGVQVEQAARGRVLDDERLRVGIVHAQPLEQAGDGVAALHALFAYVDGLAIGKLFELLAHVGHAQRLLRARCERIVKGAARRNAHRRGHAEREDCAHRGRQLFAPPRVLGVGRIDKNHQLTRENFAESGPHHVKFNLGLSTTAGDDVSRLPSSPEVRRGLFTVI